MFEKTGSPSLDFPLAGLDSKLAVCIFTVAVIVGEDKLWACLRHNMNLTRSVCDEFGILSVQPMDPIVDKYIGEFGCRECLMKVYVR